MPSLANSKHRLGGYKKAFRQARDCYTELVEKWQEASHLDLTNQDWEAQSSEGEDEDMDLGLAAQAAPAQSGKKGPIFFDLAQSSKRVVEVSDRSQPDAVKHPRVQAPS